MTPRPFRHHAAALCAALLATCVAAESLPPRLHDTGFGAPGAVSFTPQYPLWSDGADKRRWLQLPPGSAIDASNPDAWQFPPGTRLWKEFAVAGRKVETRFIERDAAGRWRFASYVWDASGSDALLAPAPGVTLSLPGGAYTVPGRGDCLACHEGAPAPVLGASALQLSRDRDPLAAHAAAPRPGDVDLDGLVARGWLRGLPAALRATPPRIAAASATARAALGTLHGNCGHCHHREGGQVPVRLTLHQRVADPAAGAAAVLASMVGAPSRFADPGLGDDPRIVVPGRPDASVLALRMQSRAPRLQMPPLGTRAPDPEGLALVHRWIARDLTPPHLEPRP